MSSSPLSSIPPPDPALLAALSSFHAHPFDTDPVFQAGLPAILALSLGPDAGAEERERRVWDAKVFYFGKMNPTLPPIPLDFYLHWRTTQPTPAPLSSTTTTLPTVPAPPAAEGTGAEAGTGAGQAAGADGQAGGEGDGPPYPPSFAQLAELIAQGRTDEIPGIRTIEEKVSDEQPSERKAAVRRKPWEVAQEEG